MKKSVEILGLPIISITEGRELGMSKTLLIDAKNGLVAAITIEDEDWYRGVKLIPYESVIAIGDDAVTVTHSENILKLDEAGDYETLLDENIRVIGTKAITKNGTIQGKITELYIGEDGKIEKCEVTAPDGTTSEVTADQISIFGKQVTVIDPTAEKKTEFIVGNSALAAEVIPEPPAMPEPEEIPAVEEVAPVAEEIPAVEEEVASVAEEIPAVEEVAPVAEEIPAVEEVAPVAEEIPAVEEVAPVVEEIPAVEEVAPVVEEIPAVEEEVAPVAEEVPAVEEEVAPVVEEIPVPEPEPIPEPEPEPKPKVSAMTAQAEALKAALKRAMANQAAAKKSAPAAKSSGGEKAVDERRKMMLLGRKVTRTITADNGTVIVEAGAPITEEVLQKAKIANKFIELSMNYV